MSRFKAMVHNVAVAAGVPVFDALGALGVHPETRLFAQMRRMRGVLPVDADAAGKRVLFVTLKGTWKLHAAWEYTLAAALRVRGARCSFLLCDGFFPVCDVRSHSNPGAARCWACHACSRAFARHAGMPTAWLREFITEKERREVERTVRTTAYEELPGLRVNDIDVEHAIRPSLHRYFRRGSLDGAPHSRRVHYDFAVAGALAATALSRVLDEARPDVLVTVNGKFFAENILLQLCRARGIDIYTYEQGFSKGTLHIAHNRVAVDWDFTHVWNTVRGRALTSGEQAQVDAHMAERREGRVPILNYHPGSRTDADHVRRTAGVREGQRHFSLFSNIVWDSAVQSRDVAFASMFEWLERTVEFFGARPDVTLAIRVHPAEVRIPGQPTMERVQDFIESRLPALPSNVTLVSPETDLNSYRLIEESDVVIVYASTIGLEAALGGKPTVVCGQTHYARKGFTLDIDSQEEYRRVLEHLADPALDSPVDTEAARNYAYAFFCLGMLPFRQVPQRRFGHSEGLAYRSWDELRRGRDPHLDQICAALLAGEDVVPRVMEPRERPAR